MEHLSIFYKNTVSLICMVLISQEQIDLGHKLGISNIKHKSIEKFLSESFENVDIFLLIDLLEHLTYEEIFSLLDKLYSKLNKGGKILIHIPNAEGIFGMRIRYRDLTHELAFTPPIYTSTFINNRFFTNRLSRR